MLHNLVDMRVTFIHLLKIASDGNFYLLLWRKLLVFSKLASAKFDPWNVAFHLGLHCFQFIFAKLKMFFKCFIFLGIIERAFKLHFSSYLKELLSFIFSGINI